MNDILAIIFICFAALAILAIIFGGFIVHQHKPKDMSAEAKVCKCVMPIILDSSGEWV